MCSSWGWEVLSTVNPCWERGPWGCPGAPLGAGFWGELTWDLPEGRRRHLHTFLGWLEGLVVGVTQMLGRAWIPGGQHILDTVPL